MLKKIIIVASLLFLPAAHCSEQKVVQGGGDVLTILACVDKDLAANMPFPAIALDCGVKDAAAVQDLINLSGVLTHRYAIMKAADAGAADAGAK
jgi:hypothetical protein